MNAASFNSTIFLLSLIDDFIKVTIFGVTLISLSFFKEFSCFFVLAWANKSFLWATISDLQYLHQVLDVSLDEAHNHPKNHKNITIVSISVTRADGRAENGFVHTPRWRAMIDSQWEFYFSGKVEFSLDIAIRSLPIALMCTSHNEAQRRRWALWKHLNRGYLATQSRRNQYCIYMQHPTKQIKLYKWIIKWVEYIMFKYEIFEIYLCYSPFGLS